MPWKEATKVGEREDLVRKWESGHYSVVELAGQFGVSRPTVYLWLERHRAGGTEALVDRPSMPKSCPHRTPPEVAERIVEEKRQHLDWGPEKIITHLRRIEPEGCWPAASTAGGILDAAGLVARRRRRRRQSQQIPHVGVLNAQESGEMMTVDHKGQFRMGDGNYCYAVTIADPVSRFLYAVDGAGSTAMEPVMASFIRVFSDHGVPRFIASDNGGPFCCSRALAGLSRLSVWWIRQGVTPLRIHKGCPWENGIHERMHRTLKQATARPPARNLTEQQKSFDSFRAEFNHLRPHESLAGETPADHLRPCSRPYLPRPAEPEYPGHYEVRRVRTNGEIKWQGTLLFLSESLAGQRIGLEEVDDGVWSIVYAHIELGRLDERTKSII